MTLETRPRSGSLFNKVSSLRSRASSTASLTPKAGSPTMSKQSSSIGQSVMLDRFEYFTLLPLEIQAHILSFVPSRILHKTMSRTCRYYRDFTESQTRRRILDLMSPYSWDIRSTGDNFQRVAQSRPTNVLVFEAQRPIDTITTKHTLHFSHFSRTPIAYGTAQTRTGSSTLVHFSFTPIEESTVRDESADSFASSTIASSSGSSSILPNPYPSGASGPNPFPMVHADDQNRLTPRSVTSSVTIPLRSNVTDSNTATPRGGSNPHRIFTDVSSPTEWRESSSRNTARLIPGADEDDAGFPFTQRDESGARSAFSRMNAANLQGRAYEGSNPSQPQISGHWSEPIASSSAAYDRDRYENSEDGRSPQRKSRRSRQKQRPTYAFELDPLDSFESWILSLKLQRRSNSSALIRSQDPSSIARPMRWEKPVSEGLDRVFREWFHPTLPPESRSLNSALHRATLIASLGSNSRYMTFSSGKTDDVDMTGTGTSEPPDLSNQEAQPETRVLEFDGPSCSLTIQPHAVPFESHPALTSMYSHHYLSHASLSSSLTSRVEFTFHCESVTINAARLLNALEDIDQDVQRANELARQRGAQVVAGSSGSTSWSFPSNASRWANAPAQESVSVVVFATARD